MSLAQDDGDPNFWAICAAHSSFTYLPFSSVEKRLIRRLDLFLRYFFRFPLASGFRSFFSRLPLLLFRRDGKIVFQRWRWLCQMELLLPKVVGMVSAVSRSAPTARASPSSLHRLAVVALKCKLGTVIFVCSEC
jgi:hypothetical protein